MSKKQPLSELIGAKFHLLTILDEPPTNNPKHRKVTAKCECGNIKDYFLGNLKRGLTHSCGECDLYTHKENAKGEWARIPREGEHGLTKHPLYGVWSGMKDRCYNHNCKAFYRYGGRGVTVCDEWRHDFKPFYDWAIVNGWELGLEIDKDIRAKELGVDSIIYSPEMCQFVTEKTNCRTRISSVFYEYNGQSKTIPEWAEILNVSKDLLYKRIGQQKWTIEKAFTTPLMKNQFG